MIYPDSYVIRSRQAVYWELLITFSLTSMIVAVSLAGARDTLEILPKVMFLPLPLVATVKTLRHLAQLEKTVREPDANMYFLFNTAMMLPVLGYLPVVLFV
jgi:hypothetical protein